MTNKQLKAKLNSIIDSKTSVYSEYAALRDNNPQVKEIMSRIDAELVAFNAVLDALNGDDVLINCY